MKLLQFFSEMWIGISRGMESQMCLRLWWASIEMEICSRLMLLWRLDLFYACSSSLSYLCRLMCPCDSLMPFFFVSINLKDHACVLLVYAPRIFSLDSMAGPLYCLLLDTGTHCLFVSTFIFSFYQLFFCICFACLRLAVESAIQRHSSLGNIRSIVAPLLKSNLYMFLSSWKATHFQ